MVKRIMTCKALCSIQILWFGLCMPTLSCLKRNYADFDITRNEKETIDILQGGIYHIIISRCKPHYVPISIRNNNAKSMITVSYNSK